MNNTPLPADRTPEPGHEGEPTERRSLAQAADRGDPGVARQPYQRTLRALAEVDAGRLIDDPAMQEWADSLDTHRAVPVPPA